MPFKKDDFGNDMFARLAWSKEPSRTPKPIGEWQQHILRYFILMLSQRLYATVADFLLGARK